jgi:hypothetical protein
MRRRWLSLALALMGALLLAPASDGAEPGYAAAGLFALPWACGEGHVVTWDPLGHWEANKASGLAYDFRMSTGTPLYAPTDGLARFLRDDRPFDTNLGNYVDLVTLDGNWLIRMAHLRDVQTGERQVRMGDLLGHAGASGVQVEHLHLELFIKAGQTWAAPDPNKLTRLFGLPHSEFFEGAMLTNDTCATTLVVEGQVTSLDPLAPLGQAQRLSISVRNDSLQSRRFDWVQVSFFSPLGLAQVAEAEGDWEVAPRQSLTVHVPAWPYAAGEWYVGRVTIRSQGKVGGQPASGGLRVAPPVVRVLTVLPSQAVYAVGDQVAIQVWLRNDGVEAWRAQDLVVEGLHPDGTPWEARLGETVYLAAGQARSIALSATFLPQQVGLWQAQRLSYSQEGQRFVLADVGSQFGVAGLQLALERIQTVSSAERFGVAAIIRNVGSVTAAPDRVEVWGWQPDGESSFVAGAPLRALAPGQSALVLLSAQAAPADGNWRLVDVGYWLKGGYYSAGLPRYVDEPSSGGR